MRRRSPFLQFHRSKPGFAGHKIAWYPAPSRPEGVTMTDHEIWVNYVKWEMKFRYLDAKRHREYWEKVDREYLEKT